MRNITGRLLDDFTDSQLQRIEQNTFLNAYIQAYREAIDPNGVNLYAEDTDAGFEYIDQMLAVVRIWAMPGT